MSIVIDQTVLDELKELLAEGFPILVERFADDGEARIQKIEEAIASDDAEVVYAEAHGLKGSCRNVGAGPLADHCAQLEAMGQQQNLADAGVIFAAIQKEFADVNSALSQSL